MGEDAFTRPRNRRASLFPDDEISEGGASNIIRRMSTGVAAQGRPNRVFAAATSNVGTGASYFSGPPSATPLVSHSTQNEHTSSSNAPILDSDTSGNSRYGSETEGSIRAKHSSLASSKTAEDSSIPPFSRVLPPIRSKSKSMLSQVFSHDNEGKGFEL